MEKQDLIKNVLMDFDDLRWDFCFIEVCHYPDFSLRKTFNSNKSFKEFLFQNVGIKTEYIFINRIESKVVFRFQEESYTFQKNGTIWKLDSFVNFKKDLEYMSNSIDLSGLLLNLKKIAS